MNEDSVVGPAAREPARAHPALVTAAALVAVQLVLALAWVAPGPLSTDEVLYQSMTRSAVTGQPLSFSNGYEELPSPELATVDYVRTDRGRLTIQYPVFFPLLAVPFYALMGPFGLFLVNAVAFAGVLVLTWHVGMRTVGGRAALAGTLVLAGGTFAWDYAMAAWPHMLTLLFELAAFDLVLTALRADPGADPGAEPRRGTRAAFAAGLLLGVAVGFRRDAVFFLPVVAVPLLFADPPRARALAALALGALPPLAVLGWLNWLRFGSWSPLSYGELQAGFQLLALVGALGLAGLVVLALPPVKRRALAAVAARPNLFVLALAVVALALFALPATSGRMLRMVDGVESLLFDLRGSATEVAGGQVFYFAVLYAGGLKKSLLQSLPWLPVLLVTAWLAWREPARRRSAALLLLPAALYVGVQVFLNRHGGMSLNLRYYLPALPFLALLAAVALEAAWELTGTSRGPATVGEHERLRPPAEGGALATRARWLPLAVPTALALALWLLLRPEGFLEPRDAVTSVLDVPLALALLTAGAAVVWISHPAARRVSSLALLATASAALTWSACLAFDYDARWSRAVRAENLERALDVAAHVAPRSLLFGQWPDWHGTVPDFVDDVIVAYPAVDDYRDFRRLAIHHLDAGRRVYAALDVPTLTVLEARGQLAGLEFRRVGGERVAVLEMRRAAE